MTEKSMRLAELTNGRAAMLGCSFLALYAIVLKTDILSKLIAINLQSVWWSVGVYAS